MFKYKIKEKIDNALCKSFQDFCINYKEIIGSPFNEYAYDSKENISEKIISYLKSDYQNFFCSEDYELQFLYPYEKFKGQKKLKDENYKKLIESYTKEEQVYFIFSIKLKEIFSNLDKKVNISEIESNLTIKQLFNYNYFIDSQPRCCFCGQLLEQSKKEKEDFCYADIEHIIPKDQFPQFTLHPNNLVPCCSECNRGEKGIDFFKGKNQTEIINNFKKAVIELNLSFKKMHPLKLWQNVQIDFTIGTNEIKLKNNLGDNAKLLLNFYGIEERVKIIVSRCYDILFNVIKHSDIRSPESLERLLENMVSANWHEINDGYSLNNSPQVWQEFIEYILYDENNLLALWEEVKDYSRQISCFTF